jgi:hypothetical protein
MAFRLQIGAITKTKNRFKAANPFRIPDSKRLAYVNKRSSNFPAGSRNNLLHSAQNCWVQRTTEIA